MNDGQSVGTPRTTVKMHEAARIGRHESLGADRAGRGELVVGHRDRDLGLAHRERSAETAAEVGTPERNKCRPRLLEQSSRCIVNSEVSQHVTRVVVGKRSTPIRLRQLDTEMLEVGGQLPYLVGLNAEQLGQVVRCHRRAGARRHHNRLVRREGLVERLGDAAGGLSVAGVESGLAAAHLLLYERNLNTGLAQDRLRVAYRVGKEEVSQTGGEQLDACHSLAGLFDERAVVLAYRVEEIEYGAPLRARGASVLGAAWNRVRPTRAESVIFAADGHHDLARDDVPQLLVWMGVEGDDGVRLELNEVEHGGFAEKRLHLNAVRDRGSRKFLDRGGYLRLFHASRLVRWRCAPSDPAQPVRGLPAFGAENFGCGLR